MSETERVLFVHAHPDDETLSTGGTLATLVKRGAAVTVVTCTRGERGEVIPDELKYALDSPETLASLRELELRKALAVLGVTDHRYLGAADARWAGRPPRRYVDSGMRWGARGAEATGDFDPASFTAAEFGDVAADVAAVIVATRPDVVVSYNEAGGYGHPDHIRASQAARRAAEVYGIPFWAIEPTDSTAKTTLEVDIAPVLDQKLAALAAYPSQVRLTGHTFELADGSPHPIDRVERFREVGVALERRASYAEKGAGVKALTCAVAAIIGIATGALLSVYHQSSVVWGGATIQLGLFAAIVLVILFDAGVRVVFDSRLVAAFAALGVVLPVALFSTESPGGSVLIPANWVGIVWSVSPPIIALLVLAWPRGRRRAAAKIETQDSSKGPQLQ